MKLSSPSFRNRAALPPQAGAHRHPALRWSEVPAAVSSLALLCMDCDAPAGNDVFHWCVVDLPPSAGELAPAALPPTHEVTLAGTTLRQGRNDFQSCGYHGPVLTAPATHHYLFRLYALDVARLELPPGFTGADVLDAMYGHIVDEAQLIGTYTRT